MVCRCHHHLNGCVHDEFIVKTIFGTWFLTVVIIEVPSRWLSLVSISVEILFLLSQVLLDGLIVDVEVHEALVQEVVASVSHVSQSFSVKHGVEVCCSVGCVSKQELHKVFLLLIKRILFLPGSLDSRRGVGLRVFDQCSKSGCK